MGVYPTPPHPTHFFNSNFVRMCSRPPKPKKNFLGFSLGKTKQVPSDLRIFESCDPLAMASKLVVFGILPFSRCFSAELSSKGAIFLGRKTAATRAKFFFFQLF